MARKQAENYGQIRRAIMVASASVFARQGYAATTIADLATANGVSRGLLYHYFASKEALLQEMLNDHLDMMLDAARSAATDGATPDARFRRTVEVIVGINAGSRDLQVVLLHDLQNLGAAERAEIIAKQRLIIAVLRDLIRDCDRSGQITPRTLMAHTMMCVGMINYTYLWYDPDGAVPPGEYATIVADTYLAGLSRPSGSD